MPALKKNLFMSLLVGLIITVIFGLAQAEGDETDAMGVCPTKIITGNGHITLNYSEQGKLIAFYTPNVGSYNIIPYITTSHRELPFYGAPEHQGMFAGVEIDGLFKWLWQLTIINISYPSSNNPIIQIEYAFSANITITQTCLAGDPNTAPKMSMESFNIKNMTSNPINVKFFYYGFVHPTVKNQQTTLWDTILPLNLVVTWDYSEPNSTKANKLNSKIIIVEPISSENGQALAFGCSIDDNTILEPFEATTFASFVEPTTGVYSSFGPSFVPFITNPDQAIGQNVNWAAKYNIVSIPNGGNKTINVFNSTGQDYAEAANALVAASNIGAFNFRTNTEQWWINQSFLTKIDNWIKDPVQNKLAKRWTITCRMLVDTDSGAIIASPNRQPKYYPIWVRDGIYQTLLWEALGETILVDKFLNFLISVSETTSGIDNQTLRYWRQCYSIKEPPNDRFMGFPYIINSIDINKSGIVENDQMGTFLWALYIISKHRNLNKSELPSNITIDHIKQIANTILSQITTDNYIKYPEILIGAKLGLLRPSFDWYEWPENKNVADFAFAFSDRKRAAISQSIYTNSAAISGLLAATYFTDVSAYKNNADIIAKAINDNFVSDSDFKCPAYVATGTFNLDNFTFTAYQYTQSMRERLNITAIGWPYNIFGLDQPLIRNYGNKIDGLFNTFIFETDKKCFVPAYLMSAIYDLYKPNNPNHAKIQKFVEALKDDPIGYIPENFYYESKENYEKNVFKRRGAEPLGWSQAWGALALLLKNSNDKESTLPLFDLGQITKPIVPTLLSPLNEESGRSLTPTLKWNTYQSALKFEIQLSTDIDFKSTFLNITGYDLTEYTIKDKLNLNTKYFWRVKASNLLGEHSEWSSIWSFTTGGVQPPDKPNLLSPENDATNTPLTLTLDWSDVSGTVSYWVQVADNLNFNNPKINNQSVLVSQLSILSGLNNNTTYYWHVIAANSGGNSPWSETRKFTTIVGDLSSPTLVSPINGATGQSVIPLLDWTDVSGASYYTVQVDISTAFNDPNQYVSQSSLTTSQYRVPKGRLLPNKQYFWRVFSQNSDGRIAKCSDVFHFTTGSYQAPNPPQLGSPGDGAVGQDLNTYLNWIDTENATSYHLQVSRTPDFSNIIIDQSGISVSEYTIPMGKLTYFRTYYWRVDASNSLGTSDWSEIRSFTTLAQQKPAAPILLSPANNAVDQPLILILDWSDVPGAAKYRLEVAKNADFSNRVLEVDNLISSQNSAPAGILSNNTTYYWRVFATNAGGNSDWSPIWSFKTIDATTIPGAPVLVSPGNNATGQSIETILDWSNIAEAASYRVQLATELNFMNVVVDVSELSNSQYTIPNSILFYNTKYYWRVNASNKVGTSAWSDSLSFTTETQPVIQPPSASTIVGMGQIYDVKALNQYAYCVTEVGFFRINVEDPYNIFVKNKIALPTGLTTFSKLVLSNGFAYIGNGSSGVTIVDISNPDLLSIASTVSSTATISEVAVKDSALYALALNGDMIKIISIANPYKPYIANTIYASNDQYNSVYGLAVIGNYLFCGGRYSKLYRWNITNRYYPSGFSMVDRDWAGDYRQLLYDKENNYMFAQDVSNDIKTYSVDSITGQISRINQPTWCGDNPGITNRMAKLNNLFYITSFGDYRTKIYSISDINNPVWVASIHVNQSDYYNALGLCLNNRYCYLGTQGQLLVFPVGNESPIERLDLRGGFSDVKKKNNYLYAASGSEGLLVFDITNKAQPYQISKLPFTNGLFKIYVDSTNYLYGIGSDRVWIVNIANPNLPVPVSSFVVPWKYPGGNQNCQIKNIIVKNDLAYVFFNDAQSSMDPAYDEKGIAVINLSDILNPNLIRKVNTSGRNVYANIVGNYLISAERKYFANGPNGSWAFIGWNGIAKFSLSTPDNPALLQQQTFSDYPVDGEWKNNILYIITGISPSSDPQPKNLKLIHGDNLSILNNFNLTSDPYFISVGDSNIFLTNYSNEFNIYKKDNSLTLAEKKSFDYGTGRFVVDNPYVYLCQVHSLTTFKLCNPISPPGTPLLISPYDASGIESLTPTLDWSDLHSVKSFTVQVSTDINFTTTILNQKGILLSEYTIPYGLLSYETLYYWKVSANNEGGAGSWSNSWNFKTSGIVPVELVSFSGHYDSQIMSILLSWETATETNNYGFDIEKVIDGVWKKIGFAKGNGTSTSHHIYTFNDNLRNSKLSFNNCIRYRLKQIDFDGAYEYSDAIEVSINHELIFKLNQNYPNPFNPKTTINFSLPQSSFVTLKIYDILGREVTTLLKEDKQSGVYSLTFDASNLPSGLYFYKLKAGSFLDVKKMIILK